ncbi:MAG: hypothetical protein WB561_22775 [Terracidiphilus sp.]
MRKFRVSRIVGADGLGRTVKDPTVSDRGRHRGNDRVGGIAPAVGTQEGDRKVA